MKELPIRRFTTVVSYLTEPVTITKDGQPLGIYRPIDSPAETEPYSMIRPMMKEASVDDIAKKAIEPDKVKPEPRGKLSKGLGEIPGRQVDPSMSDAWNRSKPAPKK